MADALKTFGAVYPADGRPEDFLRFARRVEQLGFGHLWVVEDCFRAGAITLAAAALASSETLNVGIGLLPAPMRSPALAAMEIATLARAHPGRFTPTFGHGLRVWMEQIGRDTPSRLGLLEETVSAVGALVAGERLTRHGEHVRLTNVQLAMAPARVPEILIGTTGPKGLRLAGRLASGILLPEGSGPEFVTWALEQVALGRREAGRGDRPRCVIYAFLSIDEDPTVAVERARDELERWSLAPHYPLPQQLAGLPAPSPLEPAELARRVGVVGDAAMCAASVERLFAAGAEEILFVCVGGDPIGQLECFGSTVTPLLS